MSDLLHQQLSTVQSSAQLPPATIASGATITPTTFVSFVTGTTSIATITPPVTGTVALILIPTDASPPAFLTTGNIKAALTTMVQNIPVMIIWNPLENKWYTLQSA